MTLVGSADSILLRLVCSSSAFANCFRNRRYPEMPRRGPRCTWCSKYFTPNPHPSAVKGRQIYCSTVCMQRANYTRYRKKHFPVAEVQCLGCKEMYLPNSSAQKCCRTCLPNWLARDRWQKYRITQPQYDQMLLNQGGICAICQIRPVKCIDHDHTTGKVRGLLCLACNHAIGVLLDDPLVIRRAAAYVESARRKTTKRRAPLREVSGNA